MLTLRAWSIALTDYIQGSGPRIEVGRTETVKLKRDPALAARSALRQDNIVTTPPHATGGT